MVSHFAVSLQWKLQQFFKISDFNKSFKEAVRNFKELQTPQIRKIELALPNDIFDFKVKQIDEDKNDDEDMPSQTDNLPGTNEAENITTARMLEYHRRDGYFQCALHWASINMLFCIDATDYGSDGIIISSINAVTVP